MEVCRVDSAKCVTEKHYINETLFESAKKRKKREKRAAFVAKKEITLFVTGSPLLCIQECCQEQGRSQLIRFLDYQ